MEVRVVESARAERVLSRRGRPVVVLSRHAGEGDSLLVLHELLCRHGRRPRVVMHEALRLDPLIDVLGHRLPNRFVDPRGGDTEVEIAAMAARPRRARGAVLIFPEGGNFTDAPAPAGHRAARARRARRGGRVAREMRNVAAPRPGGALAAIEAAPHADVVFIGHVGFPDRPRRRLAPAARAPDDRGPALARRRADEIPAERDARIDWLFGWWRTLDAWVDEREGSAHPGEAELPQG